MQRSFAVGLLFAVVVMFQAPGPGGAQAVRPIPRPPVQPPPAPGAPPLGTIAPDGYAPIPEWAGQTRAPRPAITVPYDVETVATGITGGFDRPLVQGPPPEGRDQLVTIPAEAGAAPGGEHQGRRGHSATLREVTDVTPDCRGLRVASD